MRVILLLIFGLLAGCTVSEESPSFAMEGEWELVRSIDPFTMTETTGDDMWARETYVFSSDSTFQKQRIIGGVISEATGGFVESGAGSTVEPARDVTLTFWTGFEIIGACTPSEGIEQLRLLEGGIMVNTWAECDGPELFYERR